MKNLSFFLVLFISFLILSCNKHNDELVQPQNAPEAEKQSGIPHFDESNTPKITWDQLPAELKNAIPLESTDSIPLKLTEKSKNASASSNLSPADYAYYRYRVGPWGGGGGSPFDIKPNPGRWIEAMTVYTRWYGFYYVVEGITIYYKTITGPIYSKHVGGSSGDLHYIDFKDGGGEYIYKVAGRADSYVDRLSIYTNKKWFSFGGNGGIPFSASVSSGDQFLGFFGRAGAVIDQIGFYVYTR